MAQVTFDTVELENFVKRMIVLQDFTLHRALSAPSGSGEIALRIWSSLGW